MTKAERIADIAKAAGESKAATERILNADACYTVAKVKKGEKVQIPGVGIFSSKKRAARVGINPATKAKIKIPATTVPSFKAAKSFKDALKGGKKK